MKILYLTQLLPYPLDAGGKIKTFSTLTALSQSHQVSLVTFIAQKKHGQQVLPLKQKLKLAEVTTVFNPLVVEKNRRQQLKVLIKSFFSSKPYSTFKFWHPQMASYISSVVNSQQFDCLWIDHLSMAQYLPQYFTGFKVLEAHNVESLLYLRHAQAESRAEWKLTFYLEALKYKRYQRLTFPSFDRILAISLKEKLCIETYVKPKQTTHSQVMVLPPAVPPKYFHLKRNSKPNGLLFTGLLTWYPNKKGIEWFISQVLPLIKQHLPSINCLFVGEKSQRFPFTNTRNTHFTGYVKDVTPYLKRAAVFIVPILFGSGIRIKILEAMAAGIPVVSTSVGAEGIPVKDHKEILLADSPKEFAQKVLLILDRPDLRQKLITNAKKMAKKDYSQRIVNRQIRRLVVQLTGSS